MSTVKLTYFNARGGAELCRLALAAGGGPDGVEYEDYRMADGEFKDKIKATTIQGKVPVLEIDGKQFCQSGAIVRHIARAHELYGKGLVEAFLVDEVLESVVDLGNVMVKAHFEKDPARKAELQKTFHEDALPLFLKYVDRRMKENGDGKGFLVGSKITIADLAVYNIFEMPLKQHPDLLAKAASIAAHRERIAADPKIKAWLAKRPVTNM